MAVANTYSTGNDIVVTFTFQDVNDDYYDPDVVEFKVKDPGGTTTTYVYGVDDEIAKTDTGQYTCTFNVDTDGRYYYSAIDTDEDEVIHARAEYYFNVEEGELG